MTLELGQVLSFIELGLSFIGEFLFSCFEADFN
jgi:hypothetical protein